MYCLEMGLVQMIERLFLHDDVIKWKHFPRYWPPAESPQKGQRRALVFFPMCA